MTIKWYYEEKYDRFTTVFLFPDTDQGRQKADDIYWTLFKKVPLDYLPVWDELGASISLTFYGMKL